MRERAACVTSYADLYGRDYYAHTAGGASFDQARLPIAVAALARERGGGRVLDIGGGNGLMATILAGHGVKAFTIDAAERQADDYATLDLTGSDDDAVEALRTVIAASLGPDYLLTCFDVAEHIDIEDLATFLTTLSRLVVRTAFVSVSTRPSSWGNRFHASVLPLSTWMALFTKAGFRSTRQSSYDALRSGLVFTEATEAVWSAAHWQRANPFRDHVSHQHYILLERDASSRVDRYRLRSMIASSLDTECRMEKRRMAAGAPLPTLTYHATFNQDWSFLRSLMDVWPASALRVLLRGDVITRPYLHLMQNFLRRTGVTTSVIKTVAEGSAALEEFADDPPHLFVTATEGLPSLHMLGSMVALAARRKGAGTVTLQHGMNINPSFVPGSRFAAAWDAESAGRFASIQGSPSTWETVVTGSPKILDALLPQGPDVLDTRLGNCGGPFERSVLIGFGLHWPFHERGVGETYGWLMRLLDRNHSVRFVLRPHPDDVSVYAYPALFSRGNLVVLDEMSLLGIDWPVARLVAAVDGVLTTYSTLIFDALAAGKPVVVLPHGGDPGVLSASLPLAHDDRIAILDESDWRDGTLPRSLWDGSAPTVDRSRFEASREVFARLMALASPPMPDHGLALAEERVRDAFVSVASRLDLDLHPHMHRTAVSAALTAFVQGSVAVT